MSATTIDNIGFMDKDKMVLCNKIRYLAKSDYYIENRIRCILKDIGFSFIEQLNKKSLELIIKLEESLLSGSFMNLSIPEEVEIVLNESNRELH